MMAPEIASGTPKVARKRVGDGVRLHQVPDAKGGHGGQAGKHDPQPAPAEAPFDVVHWPPRHSVAIIGDSVFHGQYRFSELGGHADQTVIHIQKSAPGPPAAMAVATPAMLPVPTVAAKAVMSA